MEAKEKTVRLTDTSAAAFGLVHTYIYKGILSLAEMPEELVGDVFKLAHRLGLHNLVVSIEFYFKGGLRVENVLPRLELASVYDLMSLTEACYAFIDKNAEGVLKDPSFLRLREVRSHFCVN